MSIKKNAFTLLGPSIIALSMTACVHNQVAQNDTAAQEREPAAQEDSASGVKYSEMKIEDGHTALINLKTKDVESPVVSPDGRKIIVVGDLGGAPVDLLVKDLTNPNDLGTKISRGPLDIFIKGAFLANGDEIVACELDYKVGALTKTVANYVKSKDWDPIGYRSVISFYSNGKKRGQLEASAFGLPDKTFLQHPRVSPNQKWMTFYVQPGTEAPTTTTQGVYLYNFATKKTFYLGNYPDKHPTWDARGEKIFFHEQGKMGNIEVARIGYYDLAISNDNVTVNKRVVFAGAGRPLGDTYIYQKHPAYHAGLNLVFFHINEGKDCATDGPKCHKAIAAYSMDNPKHAPVEIKLAYNGDKVAHTQHVDVSEQPDSPLYLIGRVNGDKAGKLLSVDFAALQQVRDELNR